MLVLEVAWKRQNMLQAPKQVVGESETRRDSHGRSRSRRRAGHFCRAVTPLKANNREEGREWIILSSVQKAKAESPLRSKLAEHILEQEA